ncbi:hypothetical protein RN001_009774 [Aquatica leii]|uniref:Uncharacterized protein n=1 Tax=Aquatica leii TaxID=1421715 RepID=A0AAN7P733_9COLE|nr:hypothetical protein RN001_009774 [Aquatica leii]
MNCFISGDAVKKEDERDTIKKRALKTFIYARKSRKDGYDKWLAQQTSVIVDEKCKKGEGSILKGEVRSPSQHPISMLTRQTLEYGGTITIWRNSANGFSAITHPQKL